MKKDEFIYFLEKLVHKRLTKKQIENKITEFLGLKQNKIKIFKSELSWNYNEIPDYNFIGSTERAYYKNKNIPFCDFNIYVLPTKERFNKSIVYYITEVSYEFY